MKRRGFLKFLGVGAATPLVAKAADEFPKGLIKEVPETEDIRSTHAERFVHVEAAPLFTVGCATMTSISYYPINAREIKARLK